MMIGRLFVTRVLKTFAGKLFMLGMVGLMFAAAAVLSFISKFDHHISIDNPHPFAVTVSLDGEPAREIAAGDFWLARPSRGAHVLEVTAPPQAVETVRFDITSGRAWNLGALGVVNLGGLRRYAVVPRISDLDDAPDLARSRALPASDARFFLSPSDVTDELLDHTFSPGQKANDSAWDGRVRLCTLDVETRELGCKQCPDWGKPGCTTEDPHALTGVRLP